MDMSLLTSIRKLKYLLLSSLSHYVDSIIPCSVAGNTQQSILAVTQVTELPFRESDVLCFSAALYLRMYCMLAKRTNQLTILNEVRLRHGVAQGPMWGLTRARARVGRAVFLPGMLWGKIL